MKILTFNLWHGLTRKKLVSMVPLEPKGHRRKRREGFIGKLQRLEPDLILLQEANPLPGAARQLAQALDMDEIHQVCNAGITSPFFGLPALLKDGLVILSRKSLRLQRIGAIKLPGSGLGWCGDHFTFQLSEHRYALLGEIQWKNTPVIVVTTHLHHILPLDDRAKSRLKKAKLAGQITEKENLNIQKHIHKGLLRRQAEVDGLKHYLSANYGDRPVILAGDLNAEPETQEIGSLLQPGTFFDTFAVKGTQPGYTWDPEKNLNTAVSRGAFLDSKAFSTFSTEIIMDLDLKQRRIDYILLNQGFSADQVAASELFATQPLPGNLYCSDHFGVVTTLRD